MMHNRIFIPMLIVTWIALTIAMFDAAALDDVIVKAELHVIVPDEIQSDAETATLQLVAEGTNLDKIDQVVWNINYYNFYEKKDVYLDPITKPTLEDLVVTKEGGDLSIAEMDRLCREFGATRQGNFGLTFNVVVEAFAGGKSVGKSPLYSAIFDYIAIRDLSLIVSGPDEIRPSQWEATFNLESDGKDLVRVKNVGWIFEYHTDEPGWVQDLWGGWVPVLSQSTRGIIQPITSDVELEDKGEPLNLTILRELAESHGTVSGGIKTLQMRVYVRAYLTNDDQVTLARSDPHEFQVFAGWALTLEHFHPFDYFKSGTHAEIKPAGDLVATLKDDQGKGVADKLVYFYIETLNPLHGILVNPDYRDTETQSWWEKAMEAIGNADLKSLVGFAYTDESGCAKMNYILNKCVMAHVLAEELVSNEGKLSGSICAAVVSQRPQGYETVWVVESKASTGVEFDGIAQIVGISGDGVPDSPPAGQQQYVVSGPGQVRVRRLIFQPNLGLDEAVAPRFRLLPGDIMNIDGDTAVEIAWINGNRGVIKVPEYIKFADGSQLIASVNAIMAADAYSAGFTTDFEKVSDAFWGVTIAEESKAYIEAVLMKWPKILAAKKGYDFVVNVMKKYEGTDFSKISIASRVRVRSQIVIDATKEDLEIYNIEGSPDIRTPSGQETTLANRTMITVSPTGDLGEAQTFEPETDLQEWSDFLVDQSDAPIPEIVLPAILGLILLPTLLRRAFSQQRGRQGYACQVQR